MNEGTFQKIKKSKERLYGPKGILLCGYDPSEHGLVANALEKIGLGDRPIIFITDEDSGKKLNEILSAKDRSGMGEVSEMPRAAIMSGFSEEEVHMLMASYRKAGLPSQLWATLTPVSENWTVEALLKELVAEAEAFKQKET
jgi:hypothetical protein